MVMLQHQPLRYGGQYVDSETGLHYNLFGNYDPQIGWFIIQDPIGLSGGLHLYSYAPNPLKYIDPSGCAKQVLKIKILMALIAPIDHYRAIKMGGQSMMLMRHILSMSIFLTLQEEHRNMVLQKIWRCHNVCK